MPSILILPAHPWGNDNFFFSCSLFLYSTFFVHHFCFKVGMITSLLLLACSEMIRPTIACRAKPILRLWSNTFENRIFFCRERSRQEEALPSEECKI